jgi:hypothetical protein
MFEQHGVAEWIGNKPLDNFVSVPDRDHDRSGRISQPSGWR